MIEFEEGTYGYSCPVLTEGKTTLDGCLDTIIGIDFEIIGIVYHERARNHDNSEEDDTTS
jgi:hypothetical protein